MDKNKSRKLTGVIVDLLMYVLLLLQLAYVVTGNDLHEWLGIAFFVCLTVHLYIKRKWFLLWYKRKGKIFTARRFADFVIIILVLLLIVLALSSMGVSRTLFPRFKWITDPEIHRLLATFALTFAVIHGGMHGYFGSKNRKKAAIWITVFALAAFSLGQFGVSYINRHMRVVNLDSEALKKVESLNWQGDKPLVVYFTRVGNTDFDEDIAAVSGASLLLQGETLKGNTQFIAETLKSMLDVKIDAITITGYKYPSSYAETCSVGGREIKEGARPGIEPLDISENDTVILVYPIWWGTIPAPVATFLSENDFTGKTVYLIATQGSSGFASSAGDVRKLIPVADVKEAVSIYCDDIPDSESILREWMLSNNLATK